MRPNSLMSALVFLTILGTIARADEDLTRRASWSVPSAEEVREDLFAWLAEQQLDVASRAKIESLWTDMAVAPAAEVLSRLTRSAAIVNQDVESLVTLCSSERISLYIPTFEVLASNDLPPFVRNNLRLLFGKWLASHHLFDESLEQLSDLTPDQVVDPAALLFFQSVSHHRLLEAEMGLKAIETLMENQSRVPSRYLAVAKLIEAELRILKPDSLDEITRLMDNIRIRLGHGRAGARVRKEEDAVVAKLDKLIEQLEKQRQQSQGGGASSSGNLRPGQPMQDSFPGGGSGPGNVDPKKLASKDKWGNLPPKERQEALQQLSKEYPAHYREVIEEYFRKLARDDVEQP